MARSNTQLKLIPGTEAIPVKNDGKVAISIGGSRFEKKWRNQEMPWSVLVARLNKSIQTKETYAEYMKWGRNKATKEKQDSVKDVGGFVGGFIPNGRRLKGAVKERQIITLDADHMAEGDSLDDKMLSIDGLDVGFVVYSTHKNSPEAPRQRLIIPMTRIVSADEYEAIARKIAEKIGIDLFDDSTYEAHRLMYWPSHSFDMEPYFYFFDAEFLDPDKILDEYPDWKDTSFWPYSSRVTDIQKREMDKAGDPMEKPGVIGAFNRAHPIREVMEQMLSDVYTPCVDTNRFTYIEGSTSAGVVLYEDEGFAYSFHATDPAAGLNNAFDLVRIHKFGHLDEDADPAKGVTKLPSYKEMQRYAQEDKTVKVMLADEEARKAAEDFAPLAEDEDWRSRLEYNKDKLIGNLTNCLKILTFDERLQGIRRNEMSKMIEGPLTLPWERESIYWTDLDADRLYSWLANEFGVQFPSEQFARAINTVAADRGYHPVKEYLEGLPEWDGTERVDTLLIDYFNAKDDTYTRETARKFLVGAIARIYDPGVKFDYMLIINGPQGIGKSTFFGKLAGDWFSDSLTMTDMKDKTGAELLQGYWIMEVGEMSGMKKADIETVKSFISRRDDIYRRAYGRFVERHPRQCIIVGSTNSETGFLRDITGNRRFWPVKAAKHAKKKPWDMTAEEVAQIWAEAKVRYDEGEGLILSHEAEEIAREAQREAMEEDPRMAQVEDYLDRLLPDKWYDMTVDERRDWLGSSEDFGEEGIRRRDFISYAEIWVECFNKKKEDMRPQDSYAIAAIMTKMPGWEKSATRKKLKGYGIQRVYVRVGDKGDKGDNFDSTFNF